MTKRGLRTWTVRIVLGVLALLAFAGLGVWLYLRASLAQIEGTRAAPVLSANVTVARDAQGIPLISGNNREDLAYATGFVHGQDRFFQMDLLRRVGAGELAELFGARAIPVDKSHRLHRFRARAELALAAMPPDERRFLERYAAGVNDGLDALSARPFEYALVGAAPRRWSPADSLLVVWAMYFDLQGMQEPRELARGWIRDHSSEEQRAFLLPQATEWDAPLDAAGAMAEPAPIPATAPAWWGKPRASDEPSKVALADFVDSVGSNNWAVAGSRSANGGAIVSDDMHLGIQLPNTWYRLALQFPGADGKPRRVVGVSLPGAPPLVVVGSNGRVAWGFTNSYGDYLDLVALASDPAKPGQVRTPAGWETPASHEEAILVKGAPAEKFVVRTSSFGPLRETGGRTYAIHWIAHAPGAVNLNSKKLEIADSLDQALAAAASIGIPAQNLVAGDDQGDIGWTIAGPMPGRVRPGLESTFPLTGEGAQPWQGVLAQDAYPKLRNPEGGQISTANSRQLTGEGAQVIGDGGFDIGARNRQVRDALTALGARTDVKDVYGVAMDDRALFIAPWRERAIKALDAAATGKHPQRAEYLRLLKDSWSGRASVDSVGYRLARHFMWGLHEVLYDGANGEMAKLDEKATAAAASSRWPAVIARLVDQQPAGWLPAAYPSWQAVQLAAIDKAIAELTKDGKPLAKATWGERNTATIAHPISNAVPFLKPWLSAPADMLAGDSNMPRVAGSKFGQSQRMTVTPGKEEQGVFNMPGGQSGHPLSPFFLNGHSDWVEGKATPLLPGAPKYTLVLTR